MPREKGEDQADDHGWEIGNILNDLVGGIIDPDIRACPEDRKEDGVYFEIHKDDDGRYAERCRFFQKMLPVGEVKLQLERYISVHKKDYRSEVEYHRSQH